MSTVETPVYSPADLLAMPDSNHIELVDGQLVEKPMSVLSALVEANILTQVKQFCDAHKVALVFPSSNGIQCFPGQPNKVRKPDVSVFKKERFTREHLMEGFISIAPDIAVEVVSSHDEYAEIVEKVEEYLSAGVQLIWIIDPVNEVVHIYRADNSVARLRKNDELTGENVLPGFTCKVADLFPEVA
jgi:Uma2 family endonuclease